MKLPLLKPRIAGKLARIDPVTMGILCSFGASIAYGVGTVIARKAVTEASPYVTAVVALAAGLITMAVFSSSSILKDVRAPLSTYVHLGLAGLFAVVGLVLFYVALSIAPVAVVAPVASLTPMFALAFSHFFLQRLERITLKVVSGTGLVVLGVTLISVGSVA